jgi:sugar/nucleoside kinase (ribokinase family)
MAILRRPIGGAHPKLLKEYAFVNDARFDVLAIGNALVDVLAHADDAEIERLGLVKGGMTLIDPERADVLYNAMGPGIESSGGSAANTAAVLAALGGVGAYFGKVCDDQLGAVFRHDIRALGVQFDTPNNAMGPATGRCLVFVTPDAQRTMQTYLGAATTLTPEDIDPETVAAARVTYLEGYLWDPQSAKEAFVKAAKIAAAAGREISLTLSDPFCVDRHRDSFRDLVSNHVDILFANEDEIMALYQMRTFEEAAKRVSDDCRIAVLTRGEKGSIVVSGDSVYEVEASPISEVCDTTGAGDAYAAGFLFGYTRGFELARSARIGGIAAAEIISHIGPRPEADLSLLINVELD